MRELIDRLEKRIDAMKEDLEHLRRARHPSGPSASVSAAACRAQNIQDAESFLAQFAFGLKF